MFGPTPEVLVADSPPLRAELTKTELDVIVAALRVYQYARLEDAKASIEADNLRAGREALEAAQTAERIEVRLLSV
jgi:hypothetical protein